LRAKFFGLKIARKLLEKRGFLSWLKNFLFLKIFLFLFLYDKTKK